MNETGKIYLAIAITPITKPILLTLTFLLILGLFVHAYMGFVLFKTKIHSTLTKLLLYLQCIIEGFYSICVIVLANTNNFSATSNKVPVDPFLCYIFQSGAITIIFRVLLFSIIVCQSADRFWALLHPSKYRAYKKYYTTICVIFIPVYAVLSSTTRIAKVAAIDGSCVTKKLSINKFVMLAIEITLRYGIPVSILIPINIRVIRKLNGLKRVSGGVSPVSESPLENNGSVNRDIANSPTSLNSLHKTLCINAIFLTAHLTFTESILFVMTMLNLLGVIRNEEADIGRVYFLMGVTLLDEINPIVSILTVRSLRNTAINHWKRVKLICKIRK